MTVNKVRRELEVLQVGFRIDRCDWWIGYWPRITLYCFRFNRLAEKDMPIRTGLFLGRDYIYRGFYFSYYPPRPVTTRRAVFQWRGKYWVIPTRFSFS